MIRVLLAEDQAMVRGALAALLSRETDIEIVAEVARGDEVVQAALTTRPDVHYSTLKCPVAMDSLPRKPCARRFQPAVA